MAVRLPVFPEKPCHRYVVTIGEARYQVSLTWRARTQSWYLDLYQQDGTPVALGRRVSPGYGPLASLLPVGKPTGELFVGGALDPYRQGDLGGEVTLEHYSTDDLAAAAARAAVDTDLVIEV